MAKTDLEEMVLRMSADINRFEKSMQKAIGVGNQAAGRIEKRFKDMNKGLSGAFGMVENTIKGAFAVGTVEKFATAMRTAIKSVADIGDAADKLGLTTDEFQRIQFAAQLAGVEADTLANGMKKLAINSSEAARGGGELGKIFEANGVKITDANGKMLSQVDILAKVADLVRGAASAQDKAAISQAAFGKSGIDLLNLLAQGGAEVRRQMQQAADDSVTYTAQQVRSAQEYDDALDTLEKRFSVTLKGSLIDFAETTVMEFNAIIDAASKLGSMLQQIMATTPQATAAAAKVLDARSAILNQGTRFGPFNGGLASKPGLTPAPVAADGKDALPLNIDPETMKLIKPTVLPIIKVPTVKAPKAKRSSSPRAAGPNDYQQSVAQLREQISLMGAEQAAVEANTNSLTGYDAAIEKARISEGLLNDAKKAGLKITPELKANIDQLAGAYANAQAAVEAARQKHEDFIATLDDMKALSKDVLGGFIDDLLDGKSATDALLGGLGKIADKLISMAVNNLIENAFSGLFGGSGGGGGGGFLSGLFGFAKGGVMTSRGPMPLNAYASGGVANSPQLALFGEGRRPEAFVPLPDGRNIPVKMSGSNGGMQLTQHITISGTGDAQLMANVKNLISVSNRELIAKLPGLNVQRQLRVE